MDIRFDGQRILVTGAGKGIGRDICHALHESGATVIALSRTQSDLDSLKDEISCETITVDLSDPQATRAAAEAAGTVHGLVNNAGIAILEPLLETSVESFQQTMNVNVLAVLIVTQVVAKGMIERGNGGTIVNLSSQASERGLRDHAAYCASKGGLDNLSRVMALELGEYGIRVNCVNPTVVLTEMGKRAWGDPEKAGPMMSRIPLGKFAQPRDVSNAVLYLLSDQSDMINGTVLPIDGGYWAI